MDVGYIFLKSTATALVVLFNVQRITRLIEKEKKTEEKNKTYLV